MEDIVQLYIEEKEKEYNYEITYTLMSLVQNIMHCIQVPCFNKFIIDLFKHSVKAKLYNIK